MADEIDELSHNQSLKNDVIKAITKGTSGVSTRMTRIMDRFRLEGGLGGTLPGRQARRNAMQEHLRAQTAEVSDPVEPAVPASELRCPDLPEEPKSPQSFHCHNCNRAVGGDVGGDEGNPKLVSHAGRCAICERLVCGSCYCDRGMAVTAPSWAEG